jgi:hypothetical protein
MEEGNAHAAEEEDDEDEKFGREQWIREQMQLRLSDFTAPLQAPVRIFCSTFNLHAQPMGDGEGLAEWLGPACEGAAEADVYALSFQEVVKLSAMNVAVDTKGDKVCAGWEAGLLRHLNARPDARPEARGKFVHVASKQLVGAFLCVFIRESLVPHCSDVRTASTATGIMDVMGNKGGVIVRMRLHHSDICFIGGHLAAKRDNVAGRNSDFRSIMEKTCLYPSLARGTTNQLAGPGGGGDRPLLLQAADRLTAPYVRIQDHDIVFWIGDLNYRIESSITLEEVISKCNDGDVAFLTGHDQLLAERAAERAFAGYSEGNIEFLPTYKYIPGSDTYDNRPDKKLRPPAYCDRIMWKVRQPVAVADGAGATDVEEETDLLGVSAAPEAEAAADPDAPAPGGLLKVARQLRSPHEVRAEAGLLATCSGAGAGAGPAPGVAYGEHSVTQLYYNRSLTPRMSDHKPVIALFDCGLRRKNKDKELKIFMELVKLLDKMENAGVPKLEVQGLDVNAGQVSFKVRLALGICSCSVV